MKGIRIIELYLYKIYCNYRGCKKKKKKSKNMLENLPIFTINYSKQKTWYSKIIQI